MVVTSSSGVPIDIVIFGLLGGGAFVFIGERRDARMQDGSMVVAWEGVSL